MSTILLIAIGLLVIWIIARLFFKSLGCLIHLALIAAVVLAVIWLLKTVF
ncbi:hypothetical protein Dform_01174 [Dehalogenimonas formicexedens]|uniref:Lmo0937 family membrane protein n=1 Tax=Dehalogenimonas formicexedens TaxID=1839801 RepID=A0A1P8F7R3_9CHLR|nr:DUF5670 family protein [Dehalogenimonas formicexedens]APV44507.1 hypothetical protein Dform_01174 [Dehalogenimonas formicexedens]